VPTFAPLSANTRGLRASDPANPRSWVRPLNGPRLLVRTEIERLRESVAALRGGGGPLEIITIYGGLCGCKPIHAAIEGVCDLEIGADESIEDFKKRAIELAHATGAKWVVIGDLPPRDTITDDEGIR
jgi:hypothetical protein